MLKKQGVIEAKLTTKPSFKNIMNLDRDKIPSRSKSKSQKSTSHSKVSTMHNKSPKKPIPKQPTNNSSMQYQSQQSETTSHHNDYISVNSEIGRSSKSKSPKKSKNNQQQMKKIILLKNNTVKIEHFIAQQEEQLNKIQNKYRKNSQNSQNNQYSEMTKLKNMQIYLDKYLNQFKSNNEGMMKKYNKEIENMMDDENYEQNMKDIDKYIRKGEKISSGMANLQKKLESLQKLLH